MKPMHPKKRCAKIIRECEQMIRDVESWNQNRPNDPPMDCEPERALLSVARECFAAWEANDMASVGVLSSKMVEIAKGAS